MTRSRRHSLIGTFYRYFRSQLQVPDHSSITTHLISSRWWGFRDEKSKFWSVSNFLFWVWHSLSDKTCKKTYCNRTYSSIGKPINRPKVYTIRQIKSIGGSFSISSNTITTSTHLSSRFFTPLNRFKCVDLSPPGGPRLDLERLSKGLNSNQIGSRTRDSSLNLILHTNRTLTSWPSVP